MTLATPEEAYIVKDASWEIIDHIGLCLSVDFRQESSGFGAFFTNLKEIQKMLEDAKVNRIEDLVGKPCFCYIDDKNTGHFVRMWKVI